MLDAVRTVPRVCFLPDEMADDAPYDYAIPIGRGQTTSQPSLIALMVEALDLEASDTVLEIGTGFGYEAALLSRLVRRVVSVERIPALAHGGGAQFERGGGRQR